jgi:methionyl-tRNA synthetase
VEAASRQEADKARPAAPAPPTASPSVSSVMSTDPDESKANENLTPTTVVSHDREKPVETAKVHHVPADLSSNRLSSIPEPATEKPLPGSKDKNQNPNMAPQPGQVDTPVSHQGAASPQVITIDDFAKVDLRVAQVLVAERVPKADKLLRLEVDLGYEKRQILAGIAQYYEPEKLIGRKIVIVANLAPRKMRGLESNGMSLAASLPEGAPVLAGFLEEVPLGARLK